MGIPRKLVVNRFPANPDRLEDNLKSLHTMLDSPKILTTSEYLANLRIAQTKMSQFCSKLNEHQSSNDWQITSKALLKLFKDTYKNMSIKKDFKETYFFQKDIFGYPRYYVVWSKGSTHCLLRLSENNDNTAISWSMMNKDPKVSKRDLVTTDSFESLIAQISVKNYKDTVYPHIYRYRVDK